MRRLLIVVIVFLLLGAVALVGGRNVNLRHQKQAQLNEIDEQLSALLTRRRRLSLEEWRMWKLGSAATYAIGARFSPMEPSSKLRGTREKEVRSLTEKVARLRWDLRRPLYQQFLDPFADEP